MDQDVVIVGASFAGLACATALAERGVRVTVLERKADAGEKLHTTGILVRDVMDHVSLLDGLPGSLVRRIEGVRLYAPKLRQVDLSAPGYYLLATDTPGLMRWLAARAGEAVARHYRKFRVQRLLRFLFDHLQTDWAFNLLLATRPVRAAASVVYFHRRGVFEEAAGKRLMPTTPVAREGGMPR